MFRKDKIPAARVPVDRVSAIAARTQSTDYGDGASREERQPRATVFRQATLTLLNGEKIPVVIKNVSLTGLRVEFPQKRPLGKLVLITEQSVSLRSWADVVWQDANAGGLHFR